MQGGKNPKKKKILMSRTQPILDTSSNWWKTGLPKRNYVDSPLKKHEDIDNEHHHHHKKETKACRQLT